MSLPEPGDLDWGSPVNDAIVAAQGDAASAMADAASAKSMGLYAKNKVDEIGTLDAERVSYALQNDEDVQGVLSASYVVFRDQNGDPLPPGSVTTITVNTVTGSIDDITYTEA